MREAIILAGGEGWRLKPATWVPKPLLKINKKTLIDHQIYWLRSHDFENIVVASNRTDPNELFDYAGKGAGILLAKPQIPFGRVTLENGISVIRFRQRETLDFYVSTGHYVFKRSVVEKLFPDKGDFEFTAMQRLADKKMLQGYTYHGMWFTLNTMKELMQVKNFFKD